jgi:hypothetical protein
MISLHRPRRLWMLVIAGLIMASMTASVVAPSGSSRSLPTGSYVTADDAAIIHSSTAKPLTTTGNGAWTFGTGTDALINAGGSSAIWTGTEMIIWGGYGLFSTGSRNTGARYNPTTDAWLALPVDGAPSPRDGHSAVWTGSEMLVWGGNGLNDGGVYNLATNSWRPITTTGAPPPTYDQFLLWTGKEALTWGESRTGGRYDPVTDTWRPITTTGAPVPQGTVGLSAVWTGQEMIVFYACYPLDIWECHASGGRYDPVSDTWHSISVSGAPLLGARPASVWTGQEMIVFGGGNVFVDMLTIQGFNSGGRYNPRTDTWQSIEPSPYFGATVVLRGLWTGRDLVFLGVNFTYDYGVDVATYDVVNGQWQSIPRSPCQFGSTVWSGKEIMLWGADTAGCAQANAPLPVLRYTPPAHVALALNGASDTYIARGLPASSFGTDPLMFIGYDPTYGYLAERIHAYFPLTIPSRATLDTATVSMYMYAYNTGAATMNISAHRATQSINEYSTWNSSANSYDPSPASVVPIGHTFGWYNWDVTSIAQAWARGTAPNYGLMFLGNYIGPRNERVFLAREAGSAVAPYLAVTYSDPFYAPDTVAPTAAMPGLPALQPAAAPLAVRWLGSDVGHGVQSFDVQVSDNSSAWANWCSWAVGTSAPYAGQSGHTYCFRVRARDYAGNVGSWSTTSRCTAFYADILVGQVIDQRHAPIVDASLSITPAPVATQFDSLSGYYLAYLANAQSHQVSVSQPDYAVPPTATVEVSATNHYDIVLQPLDNLIQNANFELPLSTGWITSGTLTIASSTSRHSGDFAAALNSDSAISSGSVTLAQSITLPNDARPQIMSFMYALTATAPLSQSGFSVSVQVSETTTSVFTTTTLCLGWCHQWLDLSAWQGQSITLTFTLSQTGGEGVQVDLDEVTLGTWLTPLVQQVTPARLDAYATSVITLTGENFLAEPLVLLNGLPISTTWLSTTTLTATVPNTVAFGAYSVQVQNPSNHRGAWSQRLIIGHQIYLPVLSKNAP